MSQTAQEAFDLFGVNSFRALHDAYMQKDQDKFLFNTWCYDDPTDILVQTREALEAIDPGVLDEDDRMWWYEIIWFWYHHAISASIRKLDKARARYFACMALAYQDPNHPNRITRLLWHLVYDRLAEARRFVYECQRLGPDHETEVELLEDYESGDDGWAAFKNIKV
ncbi:MAG: hypothetical protein AAB916_02830 [Patescibacteria group bacterium]